MRKQSKNWGVVETLQSAGIREFAYSASASAKFYVFCGNAWHSDVGCPGRPAVHMDYSALLTDLETCSTT
jgi:hypothetical protein